MPTLSDNSDPEKPSTQKPPSYSNDWDDTPPPPDEFPPEWKALEVIPGGFVIETGVPIPVTEVHSTISGGTGSARLSQPHPQ